MKRDELRPRQRAEPIPLVVVNDTDIERVLFVGHHVEVLAPLLAPAIAGAALAGASVGRFRLLRLLALGKALYLVEELARRIPGRVRSISWMDNGEQLAFKQEGGEVTVSLTPFPYGTSYPVRVAEMKFEQ